MFCWYALRDRCGQEGRNEGRKEGREEGRKEVREEIREEGTKVGRSVQSDNVKCVAGTDDLT